MAKFGIVPPEVPVERSLAVCAPLFRDAVEQMLRELEATHDYQFLGFETLRTPERQRFLYGFGRDYDDGRGCVTNAQTSLYSWHGYGLAIDVVEKDATPWNVPVGFWTALGECAEKHGLDWGGRWRKPDLPHVQWGKCRTSPSVRARKLYAAGGLEAVWRECGAM